MSPKKPLHLKVSNLGPVEHAEIAFGDLTVIVGPQATGKSILLQTLKLGLDYEAIRATLLRNGYPWPRPGEWSDFLEAFYGEGMNALWGEDTSASLGSTAISKQLLGKRKYDERAEPKVLYIPAQRALTVPDGFPRAFRDCEAASPFSVREFSDRLNKVVSSRGEASFPRVGKLDSALRKQLNEAVFHGAHLSVQQSGRRRSELMLGVAEQQLPVIAWTAGQREFVPLLLSLYPAMPSGAVPRATGTEWIVIEEPEMGLHPKAIVSTMFLVLELIWRGYRVVLSTHHPVVLDVVWAMSILREHPHGGSLLLKAFGSPKNTKNETVADRALKSDVRVYALAHNKQFKAVSHDISALDPGSANSLESGWGGLSQFSGDFAEAVARSVNSL